MTFVKQNASPYPDQLQCEADGLAVLQAQIERHAIAELSVPEVVAVDERQLVLTEIKSCSASDSQWARLGVGLAKLHRLQQPCYGGAEDNYIGLACQPNVESDNWGDFFCRFRLEHQVQRIGDRRVRVTFEAGLAQLRSRLVEFLNTELDGAALLHGDLWRGNVMFDAERCWLIDPAVYCGDRQADIAMTELFGGFAPPFYAAYDAHYPRTAQYARKRDIYNLYHLLNHYNLFGGNYLADCKELLARVEQL